MVFTRETHKKGRRGWIARLFRRGGKAETPASVEPVAVPGDVAFPKAAE
jgi:multidrug efflux pump